MCQLSAKSVLAIVGFGHLAYGLGDSFAAGGRGENFSLAAKGQDAGNDLALVAGLDGEHDASAGALLDLLLGMPRVFEHPAGGVGANANAKIAGFAAREDAHALAQILRQVEVGGALEPLVERLGL